MRIKFFLFTFQFSIYYIPSIGPYKMFSFKPNPVSIIQAKYLQTQPQLWLTLAQLSPHIFWHFNDFAFLCCWWWSCWTMWDYRPCWRIMTLSLLFQSWYCSVGNILSITSTASLSFLWMKRSCWRSALYTCIFLYFSWSKKIFLLLLIILFVFSSLTKFSYLKFATIGTEAVRTLQIKS